MGFSMPPLGTAIDLSSPLSLNPQSNSKLFNLNLRPPPLLILAPILQEEFSSALRISFFFFTFFPSRFYGTLFLTPGSAAQGLPS